MSRDPSTSAATSEFGSDLTLFGDEHVRRYQLSGGREGHLWNRATTLLLTTIGRRSGVERTIAIIYTEVGGRYVIIGSKGGSPEHPSWYRNLQAHPAVTVQILAERFPATARTAEGAERDELWAACMANWPKYDLYQARTERRIPVVVLKRSDP